MLSSSQSHSLLEKKMFRKSHSSLQSSLFFTTYIKINEVVLVPYLWIQTYLFQEKQWKFLLNGFNMGEDKFGSFQAHELTFKIIWIFWQEYHDRTVQLFDQFLVLL